MKKRPITVDDLWKIERLGVPSVSPDGARAVASLTRFSMADNKSVATLWLFDTSSIDPRPLTHCGDKDGTPRWSPRGNRIAFSAKREQEGAKDEETQLYVIAADGGEARRVATVATGVESFRWFPNGRRIAFVSWVWPDARGAAAQAKRFKQFKERKETGYATSEAQYRFWDHSLPMGRVPHLHAIDVDRGRPRDLFEGTPYELSRAEPDANTYDVSPDGRRIVFAWDPAPQKQIDNRFALVELELASGRFAVIARDPDWDFRHPRYAPDGNKIAFSASHQARKHTMPAQLALWQRTSGRWRVIDDDLDREVHPPLEWYGDGALLFVGEERGRAHLMRFTIDRGIAEVVVRGGWVHGFDAAGGTIVTLADSMLQPARLHAQRPGAKPLRLERCNDALLGGLDLGRYDERTFAGAKGDEVQMWLVYPPGFEPQKTYPLLQVIHGGPHAAAADTFHYRWNHATFAAQGYVIAAVNYHGSSGFGYAFTDSITARWGELELKDIEAATDLLLCEPWADPKRVFAAGGSYGGFMVAWMNAHVPPGRYAAYVCHAGCFDWTAMFADDAYTWHVKELGAWYWDDIAKVHAQSPHAFAAAMRTPTLVVHGALDYRVPDAQGLAYYNTLKARGVDARLLWFPDENHWVLKPRNSKLWYGEFFGWLKRHDRAGAAPAPAAYNEVAVVETAKGSSC
jgi:dipeptidyl aminopeptidase/acylaminoacyl peptidase